MNKKTKLALWALGVFAVGFYLYKRMNPSVSPALATKNYSGQVGDRLRADGGYVSKGNLYNNNMRYGMTGQQTFFTSQPEKLNY